MVSVSQLRRCKWEIAFEYDEPAPHRMHFIVWSNAITPKITSVHVKHPGGTGETAKMPRTEIQFRSHGTKCDTLADAVRHHNAIEKRRNGQR